MSRKSKRLQDIAKSFDEEKSYSLLEAATLLKGFKSVGFDESCEVALKLGVDPRKSDQQVRGTVSLPHGTGKKIRVLVFAKGDKVDAALEAGADFAGHDELVTKVKGGWTDFDAVVATPDMMREVGKLGKVLGPRGLMPSPKAGTVTADVTKAVTELKAGKIEFKLDRHAVVNVAVGKLSFAVEQLQENLETLIRAIQRAKPSGAKGTYMESLSVSSTMGPGLKIDSKEIQAS